MIEVCNHAKGGSLFQSGCQGIQAVVVNHVKGAGSRRATNKHATMSKQAAHQKYFHKDLKQCTLCVHWWHAGALKSTSVRAMGRLAFGPGRADGAVAFLQVACPIYQGYNSRFPGYVTKATMLFLSESGASRKKDKRGKTSFWTFDLGMKGYHFDYTHAQNIFLFQKSGTAQRTFLTGFPSAFNTNECGWYVRTYVWTVRVDGNDQISGARFLRHIQVAWLQILQGQDLRRCLCKVC
jgi:hypothetical protein